MLNPFLDLQMGLNVLATTSMFNVRFVKNLAIIENSTVGFFRCSFRSFPSLFERDRMSQASVISSIFDLLGEEKTNQREGERWKRDEGEKRKEVQIAVSQNP